MGLCWNVAPCASLEPCHIGGKTFRGPALSGSVDKMWNIIILPTKCSILVGTNQSLVIELMPLFHITHVYIYIPGIYVPQKVKAIIPEIFCISLSKVMKTNKQTDEQRASRRTTKNRLTKVMK